VRRRHLAVATLSTVLAFVAMTAPARADHEGPRSPHEKHLHSTSLLTRPHTIANVGLGVVALPNAPISVANRGGATPFGTVGSGDATLNFLIHLIYHSGKDWMVGAVGFLTPAPTSDSAYAGNTDLPNAVRRSHSRGYMFAGIEARYVPWRYRAFQIWTGLAAGAVVVADRFVNEEATPVSTVLGTREITITSEGFAIGVQAGGDYMLDDHWVFGVDVRADRWLLPTAKPDPLRDPTCSSLGDCPTITGTVEAIMFGLSIGYRIQL
jgi:hypothetical protein